MAVAEKTQVAVLPWGIEADHPRNSDILLQCVPGARLRSAISGTKPCIDAKSGELRVPLDQSRHLGSFPMTPGMQIHVNPAELTYMIIDPMHNDEKLCDRVERYLRENTGYNSTRKLNGVPPLSGKLDPHRMKSLCREMLWLLAAGEAKKAKGAIPTMEDVDDLPGHYLLNPGARVGNTQPVYEKDFDDWVARLSHSGG